MATLPPFWFQYVRVVFLGSNIDSESPPAARRIFVDKHSKFKDLNEELAAENLDHWTLLQSHYTSATPYWSESDPNATVNIERQTVYAINTNGRNYVLGVVRTSETDYPILIMDPQTPQTIRQAVSIDPVLQDIKSITPYSGALDIGGTLLDCRTLQETEPSTFPTAFVISVGEPPGQFKFDMSLDSAFAYLQASHLYYTKLMRESFRLKFFTLQMIHLSRCLIHVVVSLAQALGPSDSVPVSIDDWTNQGALDLFHIAYLMDYELDQYHADLRVYWSAITKNEFDREDIQRNIGRIFLALCGDYPGAVTVRHSHKLFEELKEIDWEKLDPKSPDATDPRTSYPSFNSGYSSDNSINFPRESGGEHSSDEESLEQKNPNDGIPEYHSTRSSGVTTGEPPIAAQDGVKESVTEDPTAGTPTIE